MAPPARAEVRMVAHPVSVPAARQFVDDTLTDWGCELLAADVGLCIDELATNATLHSGSTYFEVELEVIAGTVVRASVTDAGMGSVDVLARQPELSDTLSDDLSGLGAVATGRGMFLVSALSSAWGIEELAVGKRVWAEFRPEPPERQGDPSPSRAQLTRSAERSAPPPSTDRWAVARFRQCPAALLLAHDANIAEYTRELHLIGDRLGEPEFRRLGQVLNDYVIRHAPNWDPARIIAHEAVRSHQDLVDIEVLASRDIRTSLRAFRNLIWEAEALSHAGQLMTLPAAEPVQRLRDWLEGEFLAQIEGRAEPLAYPEWLAGARR